MKQNIDRSYRKLAAGACVLIVILRIAFPKMQFDEISLWLLAIALVLILIPDIGEIISRIRRVKKGDFEIEFESKLAKLKQETDAAEDSVVNQVGNLNIGELPDDVQQRLQQSLVDPTATLVTLAILIETRLRQLAGDHAMRHPGRYFSPRRTLQELVDRKLVTAQLVALFNDFWAIRNQVIHGHEFNPERLRLFELAELGIRILKMLYLIPENVLEQTEQSDREATSKPAPGAASEASHPNVLGVTSR